MPGQRGVNERSVSMAGQGWGGVSGARRGWRCWWRSCCKGWSCDFIAVGPDPAIWGRHCGRGMAWLVALL